ncbi:MAG TPA: permease prefix domain 1-containing protein [Dehalococcoidia bacterium]|jgi:hypothetical protein|nr:permease prefix domain 1-containing protein [Dehalococcoidia bacterium]
MNETARRDDPIERYLDQLAHELRLGPERTRRVLREAEDHLRESVAAAEAAGATPDEAERQAIDRFGSPRTVARRFAAEQASVLPPSVLLNLVLAVVLLGGIGAVAVGISGGVAQVMGSVFGERFVAGDTNGVTYTPARCRDFMEYEPQAPDCEAAATAHHFGEVVGYRIALGVLGICALAVYALVRRRYPYLAGVRVLPDGFVPTVGAALFGAAAALLLFQSLGQLAVGDASGVGAYLSGGIVSAVAFCGCAWPLLRMLRDSDLPRPVRA